MNEKQTKPTKKWYKKWANVLFLLAFCIVTIGLIWFDQNTSSTGPNIPANLVAYNSIETEIQYAVTTYRNKSDGEMPILNGSLANADCSQCKIININTLLVINDGILPETPYGLWSGNGSNDDNCDGGCVGCSNTSHYIWAIDNDGSVYSTCVGEECEANGEDGYQGVWP
jgi:hypothetical protein